MQQEGKVTTANDVPPAPAPPKPPRASWMDWLLGLGIVLYTIVGSACAAFLLYKAYTSGAVGSGQSSPSAPPAGGLDDFAKLAIAALIGVIGTGLTGLVAIYAATRQATMANQIAGFNADVSRHLAAVNNAATTALTQMKGGLDASLASVKAASDESLARLKVALDANRIAHRELFGSATVYFHTLRTIAITAWDDDTLKAAQSAMVAATPHTLDVDATMRDLWFDLWQRGEKISRDAAELTEISERAKLVAELFDVEVKTRSGKLDFRELHARLEEVSRIAIAAGPAIPKVTSP